MSMSTPPGWYPDPHQPSAERWWDGAAWTEHRRTPEYAQAAPAQQGFGPPQDTTSVMPVASGGGGRRAKVVALGVAGVVLVGAIVAGAVTLAGGDDDPQGGTPAPSAPAKDDPEPVASKEESKAPTTDPDPDTLVDDLNGITLPVPDGWEKDDDSFGSGATIQTPDIVDCPGDSGLCREGTVTSTTVTGTDETDPKALALGDIEDAADAAYDKDKLDNRPYGGITRHEKVKEGQVAVAGRSGYFVRWRVHTAKGDGGYVQSLSFASSVGSESMVMVRFNVGAGDGAPPVSVLDEITDGIRSVDDSGTGGGVGNDVEPTP
ncbi:DUF2510 domain-containing protein [Streptomyces sp. Je 1-369]|uniref:DUF2510 domain-containing protein n=1 Tax=Streptomyces sp. Je 1-369 TaxID=2966192 RepID=UPI002286643C|nr:DUF2510 domain-containing protein [Streptomyces sp. Je 1-369]WAL94449.1 DUF2510 domain-containing protein [Streptomyces sp. Je 1-369]